jgi:hypothetical protein
LLLRDADVRLAPPHPPPPSEEKRRVLDALADYPRYTPPIWSSEAQSLKEAGDAYDAFFFSNRSRRVEALRSFLAKFDVGLSLDDNGVKAVSAWLPIHADLLADGLRHQESDDLWYAYNCFEVPWTGALIGLNPIFDLAFISSFAQSAPEMAAIYQS